MTLSGDNRRQRGEQYKRERLERTDRTRARFPWLIPTIVVLAIILVVGGIAAAAILGKLF